MEYGLEVLKGFDAYCRKKRDAIDTIGDRQQRALQEKVLIARSLLYRVAGEMVEAYAKYTAIMKDKSSVQDLMDKVREIEGREFRKDFIREFEFERDLAEDASPHFWELQDALMGVICAGLEDTAFAKWRLNLLDAVREVIKTDEAQRLPRFFQACVKVEESLDIDLSDVEQELRIMFEPECIYNTLILIVTAIKCYCEMLGIIYKKNKTRMIDRYKKTRAPGQHRVSIGKADAAARTDKAGRPQKKRSRK